MNADTSFSELPSELKKFLESVPPVTLRELEELRRAGEQLDQSPSFRADYLKSLFVEKMLEAMTEAGTKQTEIAKCLGKTRQYVSKVLNEDRRINFTIETMCEFAHLVGRYVDIQVLRVNEVAHILRTVPAERCVLSLEEEFSRRKHDITRYAIPLEFKYDDTRSAA